MPRWDLDGSADNGDAESQLGQTPDDAATWHPAGWGRIIDPVRGTATHGVCDRI